MYDSYPKPDHFREMYLYDRIKRVGGLLGRFFIIVPGIPDLRCDLHPVWAPDGKTVSFNSTHEGFRGIYLMDVMGAKQELCVWDAGGLAPKLICF